MDKNETYTKQMLEHEKKIVSHQFLLIGAAFQFIFVNGVRSRSKIHLFAYRYPVVPALFMKTL